MNWFRDRVHNVHESVHPMIMMIMIMINRERVENSFIVLNTWQIRLEIKNKIRDIVFIHQHQIRSDLQLNRIQPLENICFSSQYALQEYLTQ